MRSFSRFAAKRFRNTKRAVIFAMTIGLVSACAPIHNPPKGAPLAFGEDVIRAWHQHRTSYMPQYFLVSEDGQSSLAVYTHLFDCRMSEPYIKWRRLCETRSGQDCYRFAVLGNPRWHFTKQDTNTVKPQKKPVQIERQAICFPAPILFHPDHSRYYLDLLQR